MALIISEKTSCSMCGKPLQNEDDLVSFSPFVANRLDPLFRFSDAAFHRRCFEADPLASAASARRRAVDDEAGPGRRRCVVCGDEILDPDDYFGSGFLTDDPTAHVFEFNFVHVHRSHFHQWRRADEFRARVQSFTTSPAWDGAVLKLDPLPSWAAASVGGPR